MKFLASFALLLMFSTSVNAQSILDQQIELTRKAANTDRQAIIMGNVNFNSEESAQFWPAWKQYRAAISANGDRTLALIKNFADNYEQMSDLKASELLTDGFSIQMQNLVIKQQFAKEIDKFLPTQKVMRIIQIENKLDAAIQMKLAAEIPLTK